MKSSKTKYKANPGVYSKVIHGKTYLLKSHTDYMYELNDVAALVWVCVQRPLTIDGIVRKVCGAFDVSPDQASGDVSDFIREYVRKGMIDASE